jgi:hypothetical protein
MDHLLASCGFLPEFAPIEVGGRLLGDGGLSLNAPFDPILESSIEHDLLLYVIDLYARDGERPTSLEAAAERKNDLLFGNQTFIRLEYAAELRRLRRKLADKSIDGAEDKIILLSCRPGMEEPGPEKSFELSATAFAQRWGRQVSSIWPIRNMPFKMVRSLSCADIAGSDNLLWTGCVVLGSNGRMRMTVVSEAIQLRRYLRSRRLAAFFPD